MRSPLSKRQWLLLDRLLALGSWLSEGRLPMQVTEVFGFGSFFRGKPGPGDVDLVIRCSNDTADFQLFSDLLHEATYGEGPESFPTPRDALLSVLDRRCGGCLPGMTDIARLRCLFERWIKGFSWAMLCDRLSRYGSLPMSTDIATALMKRHLPGLNVAKWLGSKDTIEHCGLRTGFSVLVWSQDKPDIRSNVEIALAHDKRRPSVLADLANLGPVLFRQVTLCDLMKRAIERLLRTPQSRGHCESVNKWFERWAKRHFGHDAAALRSAITIEKTMATFGDEALKLSVSVKFTPPSYEGLSLKQLSELVEENRSRIKFLWTYLRVYPKVIRSLAVYKSNHIPTDLAPRDYVSASVLSTCRKRERKKVALILADLGFLQ